MQLFHMGHSSQARATPGSPKFKMYTLSFSHSFTGVPCIHTSGKPSRASDGRASTEATVLFSFFSEEAACNGIPADTAKIMEHPKTNREEFNMVTRYYRNLLRQANRKRKGKIEEPLSCSFHQNGIQNNPKRKDINHGVFIWNKKTNTLSIHTF